jgi:GNAT superfamily N-acetyltransferase
MKICSLQKNHISKLLILSDEVFGENFLTEGFLSKYLFSDYQVGLVAIDENKILGYLLFDNLSLNELKEVALEEGEWFYEKFTPYQSICLIKQIAVVKEHQKQGVANQLFKECIKLSEIACCLAWKKGDAVSLKNLLIKNSFDYEKTLYNYWYKDSLTKKYNCTYCGEPPCKCSAEVYFKRNASS